MTNTWKTAERYVARIFGTERTPLSGSNSKHTSSDTLSEEFYIEVKYFRSDRSKFKKVWDIYQEHGPSRILHQNGYMYVIIHLKDIINEKSAIKDIVVTDIKRGTALAIWDFMETVVRVAHVEYKIPILAVRQYRKHGVVFMMRSEDYNKIANYIRRISNGEI